MLKQKVQIAKITFKMAMGIGWRKQQKGKQKSSKEKQLLSLFFAPPVENDLNILNYP